MRRIRLESILLAFLCTALSACSGPTAVSAPSYSASSVANEAFNLFDVNKDGKLDEKELASVPSLKDSLADLDTDRDKTIGKTELESRLKDMLDSKVGIEAIICRVSRGGHPVAGVEVKFIPEAFFGKALIPAVGKSDANGDVQVFIEGQSVSGLAPGFYRVEASLKGPTGAETLPASVNAQSKLGYHVGSRMRGGFEITIP